MLIQPHNLCKTSSILRPLMLGRTVLRPLINPAHSPHPQSFHCCWTFDNFIDQLKVAFLPPNIDVRHRSQYLACEEGKRTIPEFLHELQYLAVSLSDESYLPESTRVTVFMNILNACAARTQLFCTYPHTFEEAVRKALSEEFYHSLASTSSGHSYDMEVSYVAPVATPAGSDRKSFYCGRRAILRAAVLSRAVRMVGETIDHVIDQTQAVGLGAPSCPEGNVGIQ